jgi:hypothetical protein
MVFSIEDYNARIYAVENDVLYQYSVPAFQNSGVRYYVLLNYSPLRRLELWVRFSQTRYNNVETIGSGLDTINGSVLSELHVQCRWSF